MIDETTFEFVLSKHKRTPDLLFEKIFVIINRIMKCVCNFNFES